MYVLRYLTHALVIGTTLRGQVSCRHRGGLDARQRASGGHRLSAAPAAEGCWHGQTAALHLGRCAVSAAQRPSRRRGTVATAVTAGGTASGAAVLLVDKAPWWVVATVLAGGTLLGVIQAVFPQESQDRLGWWQSRWRHQERKGKSVAAATASHGGQTPVRVSSVPEPVCPPCRNADHTRRMVPGQGTLQRRSRRPP